MLIYLLEMEHEGHWSLSRPEIMDRSNISSV
jgi:hypothetical protein